MPAHYGIWLNDMQYFSPSWPQSRDQDPEKSVSIGQPRPRMGLLEDRYLLAQRQILKRKVSAALED
jgi:hypothetical protein